MEHGEHTVNATTAIVVGLVGLAIAFDIWLSITDGPDKTISHEVYQATLKNPIVAFAAGVVCGHLFWPQR